jgi:hypothetical protein
VSPCADAAASASILVSARSYKLIRSATRQKGARFSPLSPSVWLGLLAQPEPLADLRLEVGHGDNSTPLRWASGQEGLAERCERSARGAAPALFVAAGPRAERLGR